MLSVAALATTVRVMSTSNKSETTTVKLELFSSSSLRDPFPPSMNSIATIQPMQYVIWNKWPMLSFYTHWTEPSKPFKHLLPLSITHHHHLPKCLMWHQMKFHLCHRSLHQVVVFFIAVVKLVSQKYLLLLLSRDKVGHPWTAKAMKICVHPVAAVALVLSMKEAVLLVWEQWEVLRLGVQASVWSRLYLCHCQRRNKRNSRSRSRRNRNEEKRRRRKWKRKRKMQKWMT